MLNGHQHAFMRMRRHHLSLRVAPTIPPANLALPIISGLPHNGETLSVSTGGWANAPTGFAYQWFRDGTAIAGAIAATYSLTTADLGHVISALVTANNAAGSNSASSITTTSIIDKPGNTAIPQITGTPQPGQALTAVSGSWTFSPTSTEFQWLIDGAPISGEISNTYLVQAADEGHTISVAETATNDAGSTTATSAGVVISAASYATTDFAPSSGFSVTAIAQQPDGTWNVTMTRASDNATNTTNWTSADLEGVDDHCGFPATITGTGTTADPYAAGLSGWFHSSAVTTPVTYTREWIIGATTVVRTATLDASGYASNLDIAFVETSSLGQNNTETVRAAPTYTPQYVNTQGANYLTASFGSTTTGQATISFRSKGFVVPSSGYSRFFYDSGGIELRLNSAGVFVCYVKDSTGATVITATWTPPSLTGEHVITMQFDVSGTLPTWSIWFDGVQQAPTYSVQAASSTKLIKFGSGPILFAGSSSLSTPLNAIVDDVLVTYGLIDPAAIWNGGTPVLLVNLMASLGVTPKINMGGNMTVADWNNHVNQGSLTVTGSAAFIAG